MLGTLSGLLLLLLAIGFSLRPAPLSPAYVPLHWRLAELPLTTSGGQTARMSGGVVMSYRPLCCQVVSGAFTLLSVYVPMYVPTRDETS